MAGIVDLLTAAGAGGVATWGGNFALQMWQGRETRRQRQEETDVTLEQHRDQLTFDLLKAAREEVAAARIEAAEIRAVQLRLVHFEEALEHIEELMHAAVGEARDVAERRAMQFLTRMRRYSEAAGTLKNEAQVQIIRENNGSPE